MSVSIRLPYYRNHEELPAPLPSTSEILTSKEIIKGAEEWATRKVVGIGEHFVAKYSSSNDPIEGENLLFLEQNNLHGFTPRLYAMWKEDDGTLFIVMERLRGNTLESLWPSLQEPQKDIILSQTQAIIKQLRSIQHQRFFGSVDRGHIPHHLFYWPKYPTHVSGPFNTESQFIKGLISKSRLNAQGNDRHSFLADFFEGQLIKGLVVDDRTPVFTHSDLQRKNILVEEIAGGSEKIDYKVTLVDWESAGWYPVYWEYFAAFLSLKWNDDWCSKLVQVVDPWPAEAAMLKLIYQDLWM